MISNKSSSFKRMIYLFGRTDKFKFIEICLATLREYNSIRNPFYETQMLYSCSNIIEITQ